jgi:hypothetical protein
MLTNRGWGTRRPAGIVNEKLEGGPSFRWGRLFWWVRLVASPAGTFGCGRVFVRTPRAPAEVCATWRAARDSGLELAEGGVGCFGQFRDECEELRRLADEEAVVG